MRKVCILSNFCSHAKDAWDRSSDQSSILPCAVQRGDGGTSRAVVVQTRRERRTAETIQQAWKQDPSQGAFLPRILRASSLPSCAARQRDKPSTGPERLCWVLRLKWSSTKFCQPVLAKLINLCASLVLLSRGKFCLFFGKAPSVNRFVHVKWQERQCRCELESSESGFKAGLKRWLLLSDTAASSRSWPAVRRAWEIARSTRWASEKSCLSARVQAAVLNYWLCLVSELQLAVCAKCCFKLPPLLRSQGRWNSCPCCFRSGLTDRDKENKSLQSVYGEIILLHGENWSSTIYQRAASNERPLRQSP